MTEPAAAEVSKEAEVKPAAAEAKPAAEVQPAEAEAKPAAAAVPRERRPMTTFGREIDRLFEEYLPWGPWRQPVAGGVEAEAGPAPTVNVIEKEHAYEITAEVPGMDESNIEVTFGDSELKRKGEKIEEKQEDRKGVIVSERHFGAFQRSFRIPEGVDTDKIEAVFKNGILTVTLPKTAAVRKAIPVKRA